MVDFLGMVVFGAVVVIGVLDMKSGLTVFGVYRGASVPETGPRPAAADGGAHRGRASRRRGRRKADPQSW